MRWSDTFKQYQDHHMQNMIKGAHTVELCAVTSAHNSGLAMGAHIEAPAAGAPPMPLVMFHPFCL
jgi:hypothetical protein